MALKITVVTAVTKNVFKHKWCSRPDSVFHHRKTAMAEITISTYIPAAPIAIRCHLFLSIHESETSQYRQGMKTNSIIPIS